MQKIIAMLMIGLMLVGCGKCKDLISPSASVNDNKPAANAAAAAANAALTAQNTKGWWNWRLRQDGWMSWISSKTIATASAVLIVSVAGYHMLFNKASAASGGKGSPKGSPAGGGGPATK